MILPTLAGFFRFVFGVETGVGAGVAGVCVACTVCVGTGVRTGGTTVGTAGTVGSGVIGLGIYMICKARNNKQIFERRNDEINWKRLRKLAVLTSVDAYFAGMGIGFWSLEILEQGMVLLPVTIIQCFLGVEVGYRLGCEYNCKAYWIGGILFLIAGADMVVTHFLF